MHDRTLEDAADRVLIDTVPLRLRRTLWGVLKRGEDPQRLLRRVKSTLRDPRPGQRGYLLLQAVNAFISGVVAGTEPEPKETP